MNNEQHIQTQEQTLPLVPLRNMVLFPGTVVSVTVGRSKTVELIEDLEEGDLVVVGVQRAAETRDPGLAELHPIATLARIHKIVSHPAGGYAVAVEGVGRFEISELQTAEPYWRVVGREIEEVDSEEAQTYAEVLREALDEMLVQSGADLEFGAFGDDAAGTLADRVAATLGLALEERVEVLTTLDAVERLRLVTRLINEVATKNELKHTIESEVRRELNKNQREHLLRRQLKAIQEELGEGSEEELDELETKLAEIDFPEDAQKAVDRELKRLQALEPNQSEYQVVRNYLEWMSDLPWDKSVDTSDVELEDIEAQLEADHYGLDDVKERILEHMAVMQLSGNPRGTILCLAGPPGVGKTSLGKSVAEATGRPFVRISLGGVRDEAEIRGHRRTYVGSRPGRLVNALRKAGANNPVMLLDEVDKLASGWSGDPEAALLEVLDPEQNSTFQDHFLEVPFDLSKVLFICTANDLGTLSAPLRDRLEIIEVSGYTIEEKGKIARNHLVPRQLAEHGISPEVLEFTDAALDTIVSGYTREAGVRQLQRLVTKVCRQVALKLVKQKENSSIVIDSEDVDDYLGKQRFFSEVAGRTSVPGVATGLAWTPVGGDILFVETSKMPGKGQVKITGQLGDVMQESAHAAMSYVRAHSDELGVEAKFLQENDLHIHVPAGAVPKDGPSAGVTMFTALASLMTDRRVRSDTAMTGECTLRGRVLPVGGIKAKVLAAHRAGVTRVILPERNLRDLDEIPESVLAELEVISVSDMSQVLEAALEPLPDGIGLPDAPGAQTVPLA